jgi:hypothetical protein
MAGMPDYVILTGDPTNDPLHVESLLVPPNIELERLKRAA